MEMSMSMPMLLAALTLSAAPGERELIDRVAAVVNEEVITLGEVEAAAQPFLEQNNTDEKKAALYKDILDQLISERLLSQQVKDANITVSDEDVDAAVQDILKRNKISMEELQAALDQNGTSMSKYREDLKTQLVRLKVVNEKVRQRVVIPDAEIKAEFEKRTQNEKKEVVVHIRHIFFRWGESPDPTERQRVLARAQEARKRVVGGEAFDKVAKEISEGPTAASGGDLGEIGEKGLLPELARALVGVKEQEVTQPIETANGVHVVQLLERKAKQPTTYASVKDAIYQDLYQKEVERQMKVWLDELKGSSAIDIRL
jgi:peptidyl-prolyl cis-trans isomerase SurA